MLLYCTVEGICGYTVIQCLPHKLLNPIISSTPKSPQPQNFFTKISKYIQKNSLPFSRAERGFSSLPRALADSAAEQGRPAAISRRAVDARRRTPTLRAGRTAAPRGARKAPPSARAADGTGACRTGDGAAESLPLPCHTLHRLHPWATGSSGERTYRPTLRMPCRTPRRSWPAPSWRRSLPKPRATSRGAHQVLPAWPARGTSAVSLIRWLNVCVRHSERRDRAVHLRLRRLQSGPPPLLPSPLLGCRPHCWLQPLFAPALRNPRDAGMRGGEGVG